MAPALPRKIAGGSRAGQAQRVAVAVGRLDREAPLDGEQRGEQHRDPEQPGGRAGEDAAVGIEGEGEEDQHEHRERRDLVASRRGLRLDAQVLARDERRVTEHGTDSGCGHGARAGSRGASLEPAADQRDRAARERHGPVELVRRDQDRGAGGGGSAHEVVDEVAAGRVEARVGLVEQPELGAAGDEDREGGAPALTGRQPGDGHLREAAVEAELLDRLLGICGTSTRRAGPEPHVVDDGEVVVERRGMAEQTDARGGPTAASCARSQPSTTASPELRLAQARTQTQQRGLAGTVRPPHQHDLAAGPRRDRPRPARESARAARPPREGGRRSP